MKIKVLKFDNTTTDVDIDVKAPKKSDSNLDKKVSLVNRISSAKERQGTKAAKTRSQVQGHAKKPYRQKGTGSARQGSTKGPHFRGGGVAHGPIANTRTIKINKKFKVNSLIDIVLQYIKDDALKLVDIDTRKNLKDIRDVISKQGKSLFIYNSDNKDFVKLIKNLQDLNIIEVANLNPYVLIKHKNILVDLNAKELFEKLLNK